MRHTPTQPLIIAVYPMKGIVLVWHWRIACRTKWIIFVRTLRAFTVIL